MAQTPHLVACMQSQAVITTIVTVQTRPESFSCWFGLAAAKKLSKRDALNRRHRRSDRKSNNVRRQEGLRFSTVRSDRLHGKISRGALNKDGTQFKVGRVR